MFKQITPPDLIFLLSLPSFVPYQQEIYIIIKCEMKQKITIQKKSKEGVAGWLLVRYICGRVYDVVVQWEHRNYFQTLSLFCCSDPGSIPGSVIIFKIFQIIIKTNTNVNEY
ncbi:Hypothetical_protein [Hexamita inflata]|uniref:Hypothetical_protein n=1 Tax=Hexamita inflata TaxID=28002 RepID=A0AA86V4Q0_9EUKA|nr:Hypothetical protein HINF_LOCUS43585 [Hexamita inflata]CAI9956713.1 Hypothetical protein HINF_LOCUS44358 [Hexamita inflata]